MWIPCWKERRFEADLEDRSVALQDKIREIAKQKHHHKQKTVELQMREAEHKQKTAGLRPGRPLNLKSMIGSSSRRAP